MSEQVAVRVRLTEPEWEAAHLLARRERLSEAGLLRRALRAYAARHDLWPPKDCEGSVAAVQPAEAVSHA